MDWGMYIYTISLRIIGLDLVCMCVVVSVCDRD